jgi:glucose-6-phosphate dehydrogenase assembly protein OpcA
MQESRSSNTQRIPVEATLDVQAVERELNELWMQNAGAGKDEESAMLRARVLNLMVYVTDERAAREVDEMLMGVAAVHPCRALLLIADASGADRDIEMHVSSRCQLEGGAGGRHLCCEQVTLSASGRFAVELPSACVPLLVSDLPVFLWWHAGLHFEDEIFRELLRASDRVVIDTGASRRPPEDLRALAELLRGGRKKRQGVSDLNWARLTHWRSMLASLYDAHEHRESLSRLSRVRIDYLAPETQSDSVAPKALLLAGWLASRLGWRVVTEPARTSDGAQLFSFEQDGRAITVEFVSCEHEAIAPGGIARVELMAESEPRQSFVAMHGEEGRDLKMQQATGAEDAQTTRVVTFTDKSQAGLLVAELEILSHDRLYEEAVFKVAEMLGAP